jgi:hypothetical protein
MSDGAAAILGALAGGGISFLGQWFLAPRVERRVRAQERWERQLLDLRQFVAEDLERHRRRARSAWLTWKTLTELATSGDLPPASEERVQARKDELRAELCEAVREWNASTSGKPQWLVKRIAGAHRSKTEVALDVEWMAYTVYVPFYSDPSGDPIIEVPDETWKREARQYKDLLGQIDRLVDEAFSQPRSMWNIYWHSRSWLPRQLRRLTGQHKARSNSRGTPSPSPSDNRLEKDPSG